MVYFKARQGPIAFVFATTLLVAAISGDARAVLT